MKIVLISTYDLGHQPLGLASAQAWLKRSGDEVWCLDLAAARLDEALVRAADGVAFFVPMHTATRLALPVIERVQSINPSAKLAAFGLYAALNQDLLRAAGVETVIGGEFEAALVRWASGQEAGGVSLEKLAFVTPDRSGMAPLAEYAHLRHGGETRTAGYTEASRGCKHLCRHCPVVPVYQGQFRIVPRDVVLADIRQQVDAGATHITFGDPDFFNGPTHATRIVEALHTEFPALTYDATIKIEHLKRHRALLPTLRETGCLFVTSAVESLDDCVLERLQKHHTRRDFLEVAGLMRDAGLALQPTFIAFTPWTTLESYRDLLRVLACLDLVDHTAPVQFALRLLVTQGSLLLELDDIRARLGPFDPGSLTYPWKHADSAMDALSARIFSVVAALQKVGRTRREIFSAVWECAHGERVPDNFLLPHRAEVPYLDEPWYC
ncbi:MAG TPA: CUAEP/CCAEP-tail radical SAM protein [Bryobacteraceae bacterium]|nr:CUAEP/CCAEP-tail radical SAM protein [Bryobacteraceae bacterium]